MIKEQWQANGYKAVMPLAGGSSVNPIAYNQGADYAHHFTASPPGFENPVASLYKGHRAYQIK